MSLRSLENALPDGDSILLDTSTIVSHFKGNEPASPVATEIIDHFVATGRSPAVVSTVTAMDLLVSPLRDGDDALYRHVIFFLLHTRNLQVAEISFEVAQEAAGVRARYGLKTPDALIVATGRVGSIHHLVSNDGEWRRKLTNFAPLNVDVCFLKDHLPLP